MGSRGIRDPCLAVCLTLIAPIACMEEMEVVVEASTSTIPTTHSHAGSRGHHGGSDAGHIYAGSYAESHVGGENRDLLRFAESASGGNTRMDIRLDLTAIATATPRGGR